MVSTLSVAWGVCICFACGFWRYAWQRNSTLEVLRHLPPERVLLLWLNYHMKMSAKKGGNPHNRHVRDLRNDLKDGSVLLTVMRQVAHKKAPQVSIDPLERAERIVRTAARLDPPVAPFITPGHIADGNEALLQALTSELFTTHPGLTTTGAEYKAIHNVLAQVIVAWDTVTPALAVLGADQALPAEGEIEADLWASGLDLMTQQSRLRTRRRQTSRNVSPAASRVHTPSQATRRFDFNKSYVARMNGPCAEVSLCVYVCAARNVREVCDLETAVLTRTLPTTSGSRGCWLHQTAPTIQVASGWRWT